MTSSALPSVDDPNGALAGYVPAGLGARFVARLIEGVIPGIVAVILASLGSGMDGGDAGGGALLVLLAAMGVYGIVACAVLLISGATIGNLVLGQRHVSVTTGRIAGGAAFGKYVLEGVVSGLTLGLGQLALLMTVHPPYNRHWADRAAGVAVVDIRRGRDPRKPRPAVVAAPTSTPVNPGIRPVQLPPYAAPPAIPGPTPDYVAPTPEYVVPSRAPGPAPYGAAYPGPEERRAGAAPSSTPFGPPGTPPADPPPYWPIQPAPDEGAGAGAPEIIEAAPRWDSWAPSPVPQQQPWTPTPPPVVRDMRPVEPHPGRSAETAPSEDFAATMRRGSGAPVIRLDNGQGSAITEVVVLGRNPSPVPGLEGARLLPVADQGRSISKTHLAIGPAGAGIWVQDLHSTNGVKVTDAMGVTRRVRPDERIPVIAGSTVSYGDRSFVVESG
ncbi:MAG: RDD family protein [Tetrasphaera sp.]|nr:RDD family protein [Tetrasphaera sp.]